MTAQPQEVTDLHIAFGKIDNLMPPMADIPSEFKSFGNPWVKFQQDWFFNGLPNEAEFHPRDGVDGRKALRHLMAIQWSFNPKHEHKEAAVAYLASLWFERVVTPSKTYESKAAA